jgi:hypothetical protein
MFRFRKSLALAAVLVAAAILGAPTPAEAAFAVRITTTAGSQTINDGGVGDLDGKLNNSITVSYGDSAYNLIGTISFTNSPGSLTKAILDVGYNVNTFGTTGGLATLEASATGFSQPSGNPLLLTSSINGNGDGTGTLTVQQYADPTNTLFGTGPNTPGPQGPFDISADGGYGSTAQVLFNKGAGDYAITDVLTFDLSPDSNTSGDSQSIVTNTPAPAGLVLVLTGIPALGLGTWLRRRRMPKVS